MSKMVHFGRKGAEAVAVVLFLSLFGTFLLQIFMRYVINHPLPWTVEVCMITYIWIVFWSSSFLLRERDHVAFTVLLEMVHLPRRRWMLLAGSLVVGLAFLFSFPAGYQFVSFMKIDSTPVLRLRFDWMFSVWVLFTALVVIRSLQRVLRLLGPEWRQEVESPPPAPSSEQGL